MKLTAATFSLLIFLPYVNVLAAPVHSQVETKINVAPTGKDATVDFRIQTNDGIVINDAEDAPWQLTISNPKGTVVTNSTFNLKDLDRSLPGFVVKVKPNAKAWSFDYRMVAFICTKSKDKCYREVHKGVVEVK